MLIPDGPFSLIYADIPWRFKVRSRATGLGRAPDRHYRTMTPRQLMALPVGDVVATDANLVAWMYDPMLPVLFDIAAAWGFKKYITVLFRWIKTTDGQYKLFDPGAERLNFALGYHTRHGGAEECLLFKRGRGLRVRRHNIPTEFFAPVREHSRKPDQVNGWLVDLYGDVPRLEMFARARRPGWAVCGDEIDKFNAAAE